MILEQLRNILVFILILGGLILLHEAAHFLAAVRLGVKVDEFGIGLPPRAAKLGVWRGTILSLNWLPFGGFVRLRGEVGNHGVAGTFSSAAPWKRLMILAAGSAANIALGYLIFAVGFSLGWPDRVEIISVYEGSPAEAAGLQAGDIVHSADDIPTRNTGQLIAVLNANVRKPVDLEVQRGDEIIDLVVTPNPDWHPDGLLTGIEMHSAVVRYPVPTALRRAGEQIIEQVRITFTLPFELLRPATEENPRREDIRLISPVGLKQVTDRVIRTSIEKSAWYPIFNLIAVVTTALGIANLIPFPALDGGRIIFVLAEVIAGRRVPATFERWVHIGGMLAIYALTVYLIVQDLIDPIF